MSEIIPALLAIDYACNATIGNIPCFLVKISHNKAMSFLFTAFRSQLAKISLALVLLLSLNLAFLLRLPYINASFWLDEAAQALEVTRPWHQQLEIAPDFQPPLLHLILHVAQYVGTSEWWLRLIGAIIPGLVSIGFGLAAIRKKASTLTTVWIGLLLATSSFHVFFSQELRPYALPAAMASVSWYVLLQLLETLPDTKQRIEKAAWFGVLTGLGLYSSYLYPFLIIGQLTYIAWHEKSLKQWFSVSFMPLLIAGIMFLPWLPSFIEQLQVGSELRVALPGWDQVVSTPQWKALALVPAKFVFGVMELSRSSVLVVGGISTLIAAFFVFRFRFFYPFKTTLSGQTSGWMTKLIKGLGLISRFHTLFNKTDNKTQVQALQDRFIFAASWFMVPFITAWLISWFVPVVSPKRLLFALPAFYLVLFVSIDVLQHIYSRSKNRLQLSPLAARFIMQPSSIFKLWIFLTLLLINIVTLSMYWSNPNYQRENWRALHTQIRADYPIHKTVLVSGFTAPFSPWEWYEQKYVDSQSNQTRQLLKMDHIATGYLTTQADQNQISEILKSTTDYEYVLVFDYLRDLTDPNNLIVTQLETFGFIQVDVIDYPNIGFVRVFARPTSIIGYELEMK